MRSGERIILRSNMTSRESRLVSGTIGGVGINEIQVSLIIRQVLMLLVASIT